jgi:hypothetical protein
MDQDPEQASIKTETLSPNQKERGHQNLDQEDESMIPVPGTTSGHDGRCSSCRYSLILMKLIGIL